MYIYYVIYYFRYIIHISMNYRSALKGRRCPYRTVVGFTYITNNIVSLNPVLSCSWRGVQHYVIKFVSDLRQVSGFLRVLLFPPKIKLTATI